ncbi:MAG: HAMP domain-containing protein [Candidatus Aminicenantes bacterium]|nr:MAG: HAMP domain-containing protein [Candidatus Aminicenantes bacterium]
MRRTIKKKGFLYAFLFGILLSAIFLALSFALPAFTSSNNFSKNLRQLRHQAQAVKNEFESLISEINQKQEQLKSFPFSRNKNEIFDLFKKLNLDTEKEGIAYYNKKGDLILWLGNVIDLITLFPMNKENALNQEYNSSLLIQRKASRYLVSIEKINEDVYIASYCLLAFVPQFKTPYLREYHFLSPKLLKNCNIDYWNFREDVSGFEEIFSRHKDEYIGEPRRRDEIQTIFFPLRNEENRIVATVTLSSPSLSSKLAERKENILLILYITLGISLFFIIIFLVKSPSFYDKRKPLAGMLIILALIGLRFIFLPLSNLEKTQSLAIFSPSSASFLSLWNLTKSPADIFLTSLFLFLITGCLFAYFRNRLKNKKTKSSSISSLALISILILFSILLIFSLQEILFRLVLNSNTNLLHFSFNLSFYLLHLSILLLFSVFLLAALTTMRAVSRFSPNLTLPIVIFSLEFVGYLLFLKQRSFPLLFILQAGVLLLILSLAFFPRVIKRKEVLFSTFFICTLFIYTTLHYSSSLRNRSLIQNSLQNIIKSQEQWGTFLLRQSLEEIDKERELIISFLKDFRPSDLAHSVWQGTLIAKFNWYSSFEILNPDEAILSRFSLNVPELYRPDFELPQNKDWTLSRQTIPFMGKEKNFLFGYKDWFEEETYLGRTALYLSMDYDMLPFLYSANPYFELIRTTSIPSLNQLDFGFAVYDTEGKLIFNPNKLSSGIPPPLLQRIHSSEDSLWSSFIDKNRKFSSFYFREKQRIHSLFISKKNFYNYSVEFFRIFFSYLFFSLFFTFLFWIIFGPRKLQNPLWPFSNRVYISFVVIALVPLLLFTIFTRNFFGRIFTEQLTEKAEAHANIAQRVMKDINFLQEAEQYSMTVPTENDVLWISSTISNDVNLYQNGKLISSSRREFFDYGLLPELIDGEIYYQIQYENNPFYTQAQKIGDYSFHTLTIPYFLPDSLLLISLPFPLEQQEISRATEDLIEFLFFISVFFLGVVLIFARAIGSMIVAPIKELLVGTKEVSLGNLEISIQHRHQDEMKTLIEGFNSMVKNLKQHQQELAEMSKKVAWAEMARKVAHEIKNPLTPIQLSAEHILKVHADKSKNFDQALKESASYIIKEVENLRKIAQEFLEISRESALHKESFDLKEIILETITPYKKMLSERIKVKESYKGEDFHFVGDKGKIKIALRNIFTNAIEAVHERGEIEIELAKERDSLRLKIKDTGVGIEKDTLKLIFEPYFSTKDVGTGLGLPIAKKIIEDHGGSIIASSQAKKGTRILIKLPLNQK